MSWKNKFKLSLSAAIALIIIFVSIALTLLNTYVVKNESNTAAINSAEVLFKEITATVTGKINLIASPISTLAYTSALTFKKISNETKETDLYRQLNFLKSVIDDNNNLMSAYIGYENGYFYQVFSVRGNKAILETYKAPDDTQYIDRAITKGRDGKLQQRWRFLNDKLEFISDRLDLEFKYDPRTRPWYINAKQAGDKSIFTAPYVFSSSRLPGITCARALSDGGGVFGADVSLAQLGDMLSAQKVSEHGIIWIMDKTGKVVALPGLSAAKVKSDDLKLPEASEATDPRVRTVAQQMKNGSNQLFQKPFFLDIEDSEYMASLSQSSDHGLLDLVIAIAAPLDDITGHIKRIAFRSLIASLAALILIIPLAIIMARRTSRALVQLVGETEKIQQFDFSESPAIQSKIEEIGSLVSGIDSMKHTIRKNTQNLIETQHKLEMLVEGGSALSAEKDIAKLVTLIFQIAKDLANADGGVLYLMEGDVLEVELLSLSSGSQMLGGLTGNPAPRIMLRPAIMAFLKQDSVLRWACEAFNRKDIVSVQADNLKLFPTGLPEDPHNYQIGALIAVPIITRQGKVIGVLQLFNPREKDTGAFIGSENKDVSDFIKSLASQAAVSLDNKKLIVSLRELFDATIQVMASSIDAKSQHTSGHCSRVPEITEMLAKALHDTEEGPYKNFRLETADDFHELWIAAWMHDCGKVITPEFVVDKATKLETIYNRIHEIRTRFEVLRRDAEINYYHKLAAGKDDAQTLKSKLEEELIALDDDFTFVSSCNVGGEFMSDAHKERLAKIAERTWLRHYSDRRGISPEELQLKGDKPEPELPVMERLLTDKPEHIIPRKKEPEPIKDPQGNLISISEYEYNRGEIYNLNISRGTITAEERQKINEHVINGLNLLKKIPFPESLIPFLNHI